MSFHSSKTRCNTQVGSIHRTSPVRPVAALVSAGIALFAIAFQPIQVQAGFYSSASIELHLYGPTPTDYYQTAYNSTDLSGVKLVQTIADPFALASGFMQVSPQVDGVTFRASAKSVEVFSGEGRYCGSQRPSVLERRPALHADFRPGREHFFVPSTARPERNNECDAEQT